MIELSIIIPAYKRIQQTIKTISLLLASEGIHDIFTAEIIVSDSSPDDELKNILVQEFNTSVIYTRPHIPGIASNKNQGVRIASHPIVIFCDSDMEVENDTILNTIKALQNHKTAAGIGGQVIWRGGPKNDLHDRPRKEDRLITIDQTTYVEAIYSRYFATYKEIFWDVGGYDEEVFNMRGEGSDLSIRYWRAGYPLVYDESIIVHHVHDTEGGIIRGVDHPEWGIAKDLLLLAYKYNVLDDDNTNFAATVASNFETSGKNGFYRIIQGIGKNYDFICKAKPIIDKHRNTIKSKYDFKFLEVFSNQSLLKKVIEQSSSVLSEIRNTVYENKT